MMDECGICNGPGAIYECGCADIPAGDCDCDGNQEDALGVCGGDCTADADADGICDDVDDCVGALDACGICNGPGAIYECGCSDIPAGDCDCDGNQEDALGVCGGDCTADEDADGICDDVDDCVGSLDACGICNGPGEIYECGCSDIPAGDCDCDGNQLDALGVCGGDCTTPWACVVAIAPMMPTTTAFVTTRKWLAAPTAQPATTTLQPLKMMDHATTALVVVMAQATEWLIL